jgi:hypothetical protein
MKKEERFLGGKVTYLTSTYTISTLQKNNLGEEYTVSVKLEVDFPSKTYSIKPITGDKHFVFVKGDRNSVHLWSAVAETIQVAVTFAINILFTVEVGADNVILEEYDVK